MKKVRSSQPCILVNICTELRKTQFFPVIIVNVLLYTYAPLKRIKKYRLKFKSKPWISLELQKSNLTYEFHQ